MPGAPRDAVIHQNRSGWAGAVGLITLVVTASGVFSELQASLNAIWRAKPRLGTGGPDTPGPQPDDRAGQHSGTKGSIGPAKKLEALKSEIEATLPPGR